MADATPTPRAVRGTNGARTPAVGQIDNQRLSSPTYATGTDESDSASGALAVTAPLAMHGRRAEGRAPARPR